MKNIPSYILGFAIGCALLAGAFSWGSGLTVVSGVMMIIMFSADWFSIFFGSLASAAIVSYGFAIVLLQS